MRIWDQIPVELLCRQHLLGEHRELHCIWTVLTKGRTGYSRHPETLRWRLHLAALYERHTRQVLEMERRGYQHRSPLSPLMEPGDYPPPIDDQLAALRAKGCSCRVDLIVSGVVCANALDELL